jgi:hypothetical protein
MKRALFNPLAARELVEAFEFYDQARRGLGDELRRPRWGERCGDSSFLAFLTR